MELRGLSNIRGVWVGRVLVVLVKLEGLDFIMSGKKVF